LLAVALALAIGFGCGEVRAQYIERDPLPEPEPRNDILPPPVDDPLLDAPLDDVGATLPPLEPVEVIPPSRLKIASWDLSEVPHLMPPLPATEQAASWRTSFGSERRSEAASKPVPASSNSPVPDADIILLQGVSDVAALRRLLPPRQWRLVVSRWVSTAPPGAMTAVAIRARRGLRITGREPAFEVAISEHAPASATAVRIADGTRMLWLLSVSLDDACAASKDPCVARDRVAQWQQGKRGGGVLAIVGGHLATSQIETSQSAKTDKAATPTPSDACRHQAIDGATLGGAAQQPVVGAKKDGAGCVALAELPPS
jgi:hypothetical protein